MWFKDYKDCIKYLRFKNKLILHIKLKIINQLFEGGGAQNCVLWPRAQKCVNPAIPLPNSHCETYIRPCTLPIG
jgi:hypothetical protein